MYEIGTPGSLEASDWFDELALDPEAHPVAMGTRALGDRPWLVADGHRDHELAIKNELLASRREQVLYTTEHSVEAATELARLVDASAAPAGMHPIERAARSVQEDLCLLQRLPTGWHLDASCLCAPTRWHLQEKVGQHIAVGHCIELIFDGRAAAIDDQDFHNLRLFMGARRRTFTGVT